MGGRGRRRRRRRRRRIEDEEEGGGMHTSWRCPTFAVGRAVHQVASSGGVHSRDGLVPNTLQLKHYTRGQGQSQNTCTHTPHARTHARTHTHTHDLLLGQCQSQNTCTHARTHARMHARTHTHTHTYTHNLLLGLTILMCILWFSSLVSSGLASPASFSSFSAESRRPRTL